VGLYRSGKGGPCSAMDAGDAFSANMTNIRHWKFGIRRPGLEEGCCCLERSAAVSVREWVNVTSAVVASNYCSDLGEMQRCHHYL